MRTIDITTIPFTTGIAVLSEEEHYGHNLDGRIAMSWALASQFDLPLGLTQNVTIITPSFTIKGDVIVAYSTDMIIAYGTKCDIATTHHNIKENTVLTQSDIMAYAQAATPKKENIMKRTLKFIVRHMRIWMPILGLIMLLCSCQTTVSEQTGIKATWICDGKGTYKVTVTNPTQDMQEFYTSEDSYIEMVLPGENDVYSNQKLPKGGFPVVYVSIPGPKSEELRPAKALVCK